MLTVDDYRDAFDAYKRFALRAGATNVIQCGSIKNPGVSDIDCVVVFEESAKPHWLVYSPEIFSSLFTHGPFICKERELEELFRFTTLRPLSVNREDSLTNDFNLDERKVVVAARQARSILHFTKVLKSSRSTRNSLLILKSVLYTLQDSKCFVLKEDLGTLNRIDKFESELEAARTRYTEHNACSDADLANLYSQAFVLIDAFVIMVANWISAEFVVGNDTSLAVIRKFTEFIEGRENILAIRPAVMKACIEVQQFNKNIYGSYASRGAIWKGAEYPFHMNAVNALGSRIWFRRLIKRFIVPICRGIYKTHRSTMSMILNGR